MTVNTGGVTFAQAQSLLVTVAGSATVGDDFVLRGSNGDELVAPYELTLPAGGGSVSLRISAAVDAVEDDGETVVLVVLHGGGFIGTVTVTVTDTNDPPAVSGGSRFGFAENATTDVAAFTAIDAEGDAVTWSIAGVDAAWFDVAGARWGSARRRISRCRPMPAPTTSMTSPWRPPTAKAPPAIRWL